MTEGSKVYPHVIPDMTQWPIYKLLDDRKNLIEEIDEYTFRRVIKLYEDDLNEVIAKTVYQERIRMKEEPWKVDPPQDRAFWRKISKKLFGKPDVQLSEAEKRENEESLLRRIIHRYSDEIVGTFRIPTFLFARKFLTVLFNRLLNTAAGRNMKRIFGTKYKVYERLLTKGEVEKLRTLMTKGTVIIVPTHSSNLDSMLIGYALDTIVGVPSFSYGAGLNLYNTGYTAYFMNRLGAYRVDRRKKNPIYLETLKAMSNLSIQRSTNSLFFPGGTRSRSGALENKLKMGLLGTAVEAQRTIYQNGRDEKIFIVPLVLSYHFVLEAKYLIEQHLSFVGKERYLRSKDEFYSLRKLLKFGWTFFSQPSEITLSFGKPLDVMGNFVDENGNSFDRFGHPVNLVEYFYGDGKVTENLQRETEYTIMLADRLVERYHKENIVLTSHVVAYAAFNILQRIHSHLDLFGILRLPPDDFAFPMELMLEIVEQTKDILIEMNKNGKIKLSNQIYFEPQKLLEDGVRNLGVYHIEKPLVLEDGKLVSQDFKLLFFYNNRLENYKLNKRYDWNAVKAEMELETA
ncbi:MAG: 1-acyl-sn-glycerol-3-phosphate acyltransferase [Saprospiraceae bacterium]|nr:1-acyl-sn-glycerol-3-phosphate acyltransferase [Saprospiraceae bacterium]MCF8251410.1 1-acyl-sn-glycerol-3-phosphate acyltransferase [Saprospiraceae bacterium]MCF8312684.1 1-acyl-sn-glycerol-3-phosphate acyltransferase [Saprospiraceae bacterium]MCF8441050.1 1-acyl-sn-glycerol-3-phosphate acyltransferase [Saprospiraceae bacterium]